MAENQERLERCDLLIRGGRIVDGTGAPGYDGDVALIDDRVVAVGALGEVKAGSEVDASGHVVAPGFIDVHTHDDYVLLSKPSMAPKASQGVTTVVVGNCGVSIAPLTLDGRAPPPLNLLADEGHWRFDRFGDYLDAMDRDPPAINAACLTGHSTLRVRLMDRTERPATQSEIAEMCRLLEDSLAAGSIGLSTGLAYRVAGDAPTEEVMALARVVTPHGGLYATHMRNESEHIIDAIDEAFAIGREADLPVVISHHKVAGSDNFGRSHETLAHIEGYRHDQPLAIDVYPYTAGSSVLAPEILHYASRVLVAWSKAIPEASGRDLDEVAAELGCSREEAVDRLQPAGGIFFMMDEDDVQRILSYPYAMVGSDGLPNDEHPHPRLWGTFPRVLGHYCRELGLFPLEEAVRRMTGLPAERFGLKDRGVIRPGAYADLVLFDPDTVIDRATFEQPMQPSAGIALVMVNGRPVWRDGAETGDRSGRALRLQDLDPPMAGRD